MAEKTASKTFKTSSKTPSEGSSKINSRTQISQMLNPQLGVKKLQKSQESRDLGHSVWSGAQHWYFLKAPVVLMGSQDGDHVRCSSQLSSSFSHFQETM